MKLDPGFLVALVWSLVFAGVWGIRAGLESNNGRYSAIGAVFVAFGFLISLIR